MSFAAQTTNGLYDRAKHVQSLRGLKKRGEKILPDESNSPVIAQKKIENDSPERQMPKAFTSRNSLENVISESLLAFHLTAVDQLQLDLAFPVPMSAK